MRRLLLSLGLLGAIVVAALAFSGVAYAGPTVTWQGNGTTNGFCDNSDEGLTGVPPQSQGWLFILTSPDTGPWMLSATFAQSGPATATGTQMGNGSVHFVVDTSIGDQLQTASATNGTDNSVLTVSGCTVNSSSPTSGGPGGSGTSGGPGGSGTSGGPGGSPPTGGSGGTGTTSSSTGGTGGSGASTASASAPVTAAASGSTATPTAPVQSATAVHTGLPWAGSGPWVQAAAATGLALLLAGYGLRRRWAR
jgi:hypothetical protein